MEKSAEGTVGAARAEGQNDERRRRMMKRDGIASDHLPTQAAALPQDELVAGLSGQPESIHTQALLAQASVARMTCNEIRGTEPPSISLRAIEATKSTLYAVFSRRSLGERE